MRTDHLQRRTAAELEPFIASKASGTILIYRGHLERFQRFATSNNVPLYPITADLVAIFLHEMVSLGAYKVTPILTTLNALRNNTGAIWQGSLAEDDYRGALAKYPAIVDLMGKIFLLKMRSYTHVSQRLTWKSLLVVAAKGASETAATAANNEDEMATPPESVSYEVAAYSRATSLDLSIILLQPARSRDASSPTDIEPQLGDPNRVRSYSLARATAAFYLELILRFPLSRHSCLASANAFPPSGLSLRCFARPSCLSTT